MYGKIPFITSYAAFSPGRNNEQIRTTIALNEVPVKIAGMHSGISVGPDGGTHQALEDIALMRVIPNMTVLYPSDSEEARKATLASVKVDGPVYIRLAREKTPAVTTSHSPFTIGKANVLWESSQPEVAIFATGTLVYSALKAAENLVKEFAVTVVSVPTIKPLDTKLIVDVVSKAGAVVSVEEHQVAGGLGSAIAETLVQHHPVPMEFVGVQNRFGQSGETKELYEEYGLTISHIMGAARKVMHRKNKNNGKR